MILPNKIVKEIEKDRNNYWGQFEHLHHIDYKNLPAPQWLVDQEVFREYGKAVNWVIKIMNHRNYSLKDIQLISRNDDIEKVCGSRPKGYNMVYFPFELGYSCPLCSSPVSKMDINNERESLRLEWSEYKNHMYCTKCNLDIPSFLCAEVSNKDHVAFYERIFLEMIEEIKDPFLRIIEAQKKAYKNLRNRIKYHLKKENKLKNQNRLPI